MEVKVLWTDTSLAQLQEIFDYYNLRASSSVARKIIKRFNDNIVRIVAVFDCRQNPEKIVVVLEK